MAEERSKRELWSQILVSLLVGGLVFLFSLSKIYERAELVTYDWRFHIRNTLFGPPPMYPGLGTIEIDDQSVEVEGRYQDWTRDKYIEIVRLLEEYGARMIAFDVFFIEPSTKLVSEEQLLGLGEIGRDSVEDLLTRVDYDEIFRQAIKEAGNVYLALYVGVAEEGLDPEVVRQKMAVLTPDQEAALEIIRQNSPRLMVDPQASTLVRTFYLELPLRQLRETARGFAFAQTEADVDGARRRYPMVYQYDDIVLPSIVLLMVCDYLEVPITSVEVRPGDHIRLPGAHMPIGMVKDIEIPIDERGYMNVNWPGRWEQSFVRYPHITLRWAYRREQQQKLLDAVKKLVADDPQLGRNPEALPAVLSRMGYVNQKANQGALVTWFQTRAIEAELRRDPALKSVDFWRSNGIENPGKEMLVMFAAIRRNNRIADFLSRSPAASAKELQAAFPEYGMDELIQGAYFVRSRMVEGKLPESAHPLYFYPYVKLPGSQYLTPEELRGRVLFYGQTAQGSTDLSVTPFQGDFPMVGIYSSVFNTILEEQFIVRAPKWVIGVLIIALGVLLSLVVPRIKVIQGAVLLCTVFLLYLEVALLCFSHLGIWLEMVGPLAVLLSGYLAMTIYGYLIKEKEKDFVQGAFGHYLSPSVVEYIMENPSMINQLGGEERVMSAFFSDIASFSTLSECLTPGELVHFINEYLTEMCDIIESYGGTIDKFEGDAVVAFFGAPIYYEDHAMRAVMASIDQQHKLADLRRHWSRDGVLPPRLEQLRQHWAHQGRTFVHVRMGVTAGPMIVGNMGSRKRTDYTMMGDTVNLAARFESGQKIYGTSIMINDRIYEVVKDVVETRKLDVVQVVGKEESVTAYEVLDRKGMLTPEKYQVLEYYEQGLAAYENFEFARAHGFFARALEIDPHDGPSILYADRCEEFAVSPPGDLVFRPQIK